MVVWESRCPSKVHPACGDQTERRAAARAADASTSGARGPNEREVHADPSRRTRAAELPPYVAPFSYDQGHEGIAGAQRGAEDSPMRYSLTPESGIGARQMSRAHAVRMIGAASWR